MGKKTVIETEAPNPEVFGEETGMVTKGKAEVKDGVQYNALGLESTADMKHVSKIWQDKCTPFLDFAEQVQRRQGGKVDLLKSQDYVRVDDTLHLPTGEGFTEFGMYSLVTKYCDLPVGMTQFLRSTEWGNGDPKSPEMVKKHWSDLATYLNFALEQSNYRWEDARDRGDKTRDLLLRIRPDEDGNPVIRMVGSDRYGILNNYEVLEMIQNALPASDIDKALASHVFDNGDDMKGNILLPDNMKKFPDSDYGVGIAFSNSEIGKKTVEIHPFLFRAICLNGCIWGRRNMTQGVSKKHLGEMNKDDIAEHVKYVCQIALSEGHSLLEQMNFSRDASVPEDLVGNVIAYLTRENKMTVAEGKAWYNDYQVEPYSSGFGIVNGLTRAAQRYDGNDRWNLENIAGSILTPSLTATKEQVVNRWDKVVERASELEEKTVKQYLREIEPVTN
jgi:hypothetical protein